MRYLTPHDLLLIHQALLSEFGGMHGITEAGFGRLETAAFAPRQSMFGDDLYPDLPSKAAALVAAIAGNHPFSDGNKRVAVAALDLMLQRNGAQLTATNAELYAFAIATANGMERDAIVAWVRAHCSVQTAHLTLGDLLEIRDVVGAHEPERFAIANSAGLLTALTTPFQGAFGQQAFPTLLDKAAALVFLLVNNHPFYDGNKRMAAAALRLFLERNGAPLQASDDDLDELTQLLTTTHDPRDKRILAWISRRLP